jgi:hypothetical protein
MAGVSSDGTIEGRYETTKAVKPFLAKLQGSGQRIAGHPSLP